MILHDVLRLYPLVPVNGRITAAATKLGKFSLPTGMVFLLQTQLVHHGLEIWGEDATEFKPERFYQGVSHSTKGNVALFPFGWDLLLVQMRGIHAMLEAKLVLTMILQRFSVELSPSYSHATISLITLNQSTVLP
ncbi:unnamed protein product [Coffea canephora]|uniref:Uncharacterized protein n=1 Tax=Coffea canephora TaxID=49390 RepID=A0A068V121_COFCA|nr:unnamed protein product [Coffea canephora]